MHIFMMNSNFVVFDPKVEVGEILGTVQFISHVIYCWNGEAILDLNFIYGSIISTKVPNPVFFFLANNTGEEKGYGWDV